MSNYNCKGRHPVTNLIQGHTLQSFNSKKLFSVIQIQHSPPPENHLELEKLSSMSIA